uniref:Rad60/SUMO-like domain-containing protein n=1 Tax=Capra hircus TaxID=9925 RepID=A0A8C2NPX7_CAPHI
MLPVLAITENNDHINLKLVGQVGSVVQFKIKRHTPLSKLMKAYCEQGLSKRQIRSQFDGHPIKETDIPAQLEDADTINQLVYVGDVHKHTAFFKKLNGQWYVLIDIQCRWDGGKNQLCEKTPFSPLVACSSALIFIFH